MGLGERGVELGGGGGVEIGVPLDPRDDEAARGLGLVVARRCDLFEIDQHAVCGDIGRLRGLHLVHGREHRHADRGENRENAGESGDQLVRDTEVGEDHVNCLGNRWEGRPG